MASAELLAGCARVAVSLAASRVRTFGGISGMATSPGSSVYTAHWPFRFHAHPILLLLFAHHQGGLAAWTPALLPILTGAMLIPLSPGTLRERHGLLFRPSHFCPFPRQGPRPRHIRRGVPGAPPRPHDRQAAH